MLKAVSLSHSDQKFEFLSVFNEKEQTWLVSDLRSKLDLQAQLLTRAPGFEDHSVLRASELWRLFLRRLRPELRIAPREFVKSWLKHHLKKSAQQNPNGLLQPQSADSFLALMDLFAPIFIDPLGPSRLADFFDSQPTAAERWKVWSELSYALFQIIMKEKWVLASWIPAILLHEPDLEKVWNRPLWVDLGAGLRQSEAQLFKRLAKTNQVTVLTPNLESRNQFEFLLEPCRDLFDSSEQKEKKTGRVPSGQNECLRFSGPLAEIKQAVAKVRQWLKEGVSPEKIVIVAAQIENYWPLLEPYFDQEGIPVHKDSVARLQSWPFVASWVARLRLRTGQVSFAEAELAINPDELSLRFEKFKALFCNALELEDLEKSHELKNFFLKGTAPHEEMDLEQFMAWTARDWRELENWEGFEIILKDFLRSVPLDVKMDAASWLSYLESVLCKKEIRIKSADLSGVAFLNLSSVEGLQFQKRIFLGLTEADFKPHSTALVNAFEFNRLGWDFGYFLDHPEQSLLNFELEWALQTPSEEDLLCFPATSFSGSAQAPHPLWIQKGGSEKVHLPLPTRWDEIQNSGQALPAKAQRDLGILGDDFLQLTEVPRFSISAIEKYRTCSFQFASERIFHLLDLPDRDLDLDARSKGSFAHKIFEKLTHPPRRFDWSADELRSLLEETKIELDLQYEGPFWAIEKERHLQMALRFLRFEQEWAEKFPQAKIEAREKKFSFFYDPGTQTFHKGGQEGFIPIRGTIDRIETDSQGWKLVVDYKRRHDTKQSFSHWIEKNFLQLGFYAWVIDRNFVEGLSEGQVGGAVTFAYQILEKRRGLVLPQIMGRLAPKMEPKEASLDLKNNFYEEFEQLLKQILNQALGGEIKAFPFRGDLSICEQCRWSRLCRAPHLN